MDQSEMEEIIRMGAIEDVMKQMRVNSLYAFSLNGLLNTIESVIGMGNFLSYILFGVASRSQHLLVAVSFCFSVNGFIILVSTVASQYVAEYLPLMVIYRLHHLGASALYLTTSSIILMYDGYEAACGGTAGVSCGIVHLVHVLFVFWMKMKQANTGQAI